VLHCGGVKSYQKSVSLRGKSHLHLFGCVAVYVAVYVAVCVLQCMLQCVCCIELQSGHTKTVCAFEVNSTYIFVGPVAVCVAVCVAAWVLQ